MERGHYFGRAAMVGALLLAACRGSEQQEILPNLRAGSPDYTTYPVQGTNEPCAGGVREPDYGVSIYGKHIFNTVIAEAQPERTYLPTVEASAAGRDVSVGGKYVNYEGEFYTEDSSSFLDGKWHYIHTYDPSLSANVTYTGPSGTPQSQRYGGAPEPHTIQGVQFCADPEGHVYSRLIPTSQSNP